MTNDKRKPGRPYTPEHLRRESLFRLRLTQDEREELERLAEEHGCTPTQYIRSRVFGK
jgi:hypothetical protein